jgi:hypothetical protein
VLSQAETLGLKVDELLKPAAALDVQLNCGQVRVLTAQPFSRDS